MPMKNVHKSQSSQSDLVENLQEKEKGVQIFHQVDEIEIVTQVSLHWVDEVWTENLWEQEIDIKFMTVRDG